jgi:radical SAM protein with 4Fe4S-binding SPASM domain
VSNKAHAKDITGLPPGGARLKLADALPLETPLVVQFHPINRCNIRCNYCSFSVKKSEQTYVSMFPVMNFDLYKKGIDELAAFPTKVKTLRLAGLGEPLMHKLMCNMIAYATKMEVAERTEISTNGLLLDRETAGSVVESGLSRLVISIQGLSSTRYKEICGKAIDFDMLLDNLQYLYKNKGTMHIHVKIIDTALENEEERNRFHHTFGGVCDTIGIEYAVPIQPSLPTDNNIWKRDLQHTQYGLPVAEGDVICPLPFYLIHIAPDGMAVPCCAFGYPAYIGDLNKQTMRELWHGKQFTEFREQMIEGKSTVGSVCRSCNINKYRMFPEDRLDEHRDRLRKIYGGCTG